MSTFEVQWTEAQSVVKAAANKRRLFMSNMKDLTVTFSQTDELHDAGKYWHCGNLWTFFLWVCVFPQPASPRVTLLRQCKHWRSVTDQNVCDSLQRHSVTLLVPDWHERGFYLSQRKSCLIFVDHTSGMELMLKLWPAAYKVSVVFSLAACKKCLNYVPYHKDCLTLTLHCLWCVHGTGPHGNVVVLTIDFAAQRERRKHTDFIIRCIKHTKIHKTHKIDVYNIC